MVLYFKYDKVVTLIHSLKLTCKLLWTWSVAIKDDDEESHHYGGVVYLQELYIRGQ